jgi:hypothetical protein
VIDAAVSILEGGQGNLERENILTVAVFPHSRLRIRDTLGHVDRLQACCMTCLDFCKLSCDSRSDLRRAAVCNHNHLALIAIASFVVQIQDVAASECKGSLVNHKEVFSVWPRARRL